MEKVIITNHSEVHMATVLERCANVIKQGRTSTNRHGDQFAHRTRYVDGSVIVSERRKNSDSFTVYSA